MTTDTKYVVEKNCTTGEEIIREYTAEEYAQAEINAEAYAIAKAARDAEELRVNSLKESARAKLVAGEPLTEEEASVLVI
jgi:16S rRNA C967 or C1407 C5-methylase (RsmB/RsmF family)